MASRSLGSRDSRVCDCACARCSAKSSRDLIPASGDCFWRASNFASSTKNCDSRMPSRLNSENNSRRPPRPALRGHRNARAPKRRIPLAPRQNPGCTSCDSPVPAWFPLQPSGLPIKPQMKLRKWRIPIAANIGNSGRSSAFPLERCRGKFDTANLHSGKFDSCQALLHES